MKWLQATACIKMWTKECPIKLLKLPQVLGNKYVVDMEIAFIINETIVEQFSSVIEYNFLRDWFKWIK